MPRQMTELLWQISRVSVKTIEWFEAGTAHAVEGVEAEGHDEGRALVVEVAARGDGIAAVLGPT